MLGTTLITHQTGPEGKKAAQHYYDSIDLIDRAAQNLDYNKYD